MEENIRIELSDLLTSEDKDRYIVYRTLLRSFESDVIDGVISFEDLKKIEAVAADIFNPIMRLSSIDLKLSIEDYRERKSKVKEPKPIPIPKSATGNSVRNCKWCGTEFIVPRVGRPKNYCSGKCRRSYYLKKHECDCVCKHCGRVFLSVDFNKASYCSPECYIQERFHSVKEIPFEPAYGPSAILYTLKLIQDDRNLSNEEFRHLVKMLARELEACIDQLKSRKDNGKEKAAEEDNKD